MFGMVLRFLVTTAAVPLSAHYMEGVHAETELAAIVVGAILAAIYLLLRPVLRMLLSVFNFCTLGLLNMFVDAWLIVLVSDMAGGVSFDSFWWALAVSGAISVLRMGIDIVTGKGRK